VDKYLNQTWSFKMIRKFMDMLAEAEAPVKDKTATKVKGFDTPVGGAMTAGKAKSSSPMRHATKAKTMASVKPINDPSAYSFLRDLDKANLGGDEADSAMGTSETTPENLPAVISTAISASGDSKLNPEWHMVKNLPNYQMKAGIRQLGKMLFGSFTDTPIDEIQVLSTLSNPETDVKAMAHWITRNGVRDDVSEIDFSQIIPGYKADIQLWSVSGFQFMICKDQFGFYLYGWPGGRGVHLGNDAPMKELN
jgi:hypothetical protein